MKLYILGLLLLMFSHLALSHPYPKHGLKYQTEDGQTYTITIEKRLGAGDVGVAYRVSSPEAYGRPFVLKVPKYYAFDDADRKGASQTLSVADDREVSRVLNENLKLGEMDSLLGEGTLIREGVPVGVTAKIEVQYSLVDFYKDPSISQSQRQEASRQIRQLFTKSRSQINAGKPALLDLNEGNIRIQMLDRRPIVRVIDAAVYEDGMVNGRPISKKSALTHLGMNGIDIQEIVCSQ